MLRRWIIRSLFLVPLVFFLAVWVASQSGLMGAWWTWHGADWAVGAVNGDVFYVHTPDLRLANRPPTFEFHASMALRDLGKGPLIGGFHWGVAPDNPAWRGLFFHLGLPTLLLAGLNWLVWWATRQRACRGAFPIEPTAAAK